MNAPTVTIRCKRVDQGKEGGCGWGPGGATIMRYNEILNKNVTF